MDKPVINWHQNDLLVVEDSVLKFLGQERGLLWFNNPNWSDQDVGLWPKMVEALVQSGTWKQIPYDPGTTPTKPGAETPEV